MSDHYVPSLSFDCIEVYYKRELCMSAIILPSFTREGVCVCVCVVLATSTSFGCDMQMVSGCSTLFFEDL